MIFSPNDSPFAGKVGKFLTGAKIGERLMAEAETSVSLKVRQLEENKDSWEVQVRREPGGLPWSSSVARPGLLLLSIGRRAHRHGCESPRHPRDAAVSAPRPAGPRRAAAWPPDRKHAQRGL